MDKLSKSLVSAISAHAKRDAPRECCGLVIRIGKKQRYVACQNIAIGTEHFVIEPQDYAAAEDIGEVIAVVHSHPSSGSTASAADVAGCNSSMLPWIILGKDEDLSVIFPGGSEAGYVGRIYVHGIFDCYSIVRDWYSRERGVLLDDFPRRDLWWKAGKDLYCENFASQGFVETTGKDPQVGDVFLMRIESPVSNHAAVYVGAGMVLHHQSERLSCRAIYNDILQRATTHFLRHKSCVK